MFRSFILLCCVCPIIASAVTINVPGDSPTIQAAVNATNPGDTINVAAGTYTESVTVNHSVTINGVGATTIVAGPTATVGIAQAGAFVVQGNVTVTISNLTIQNSKAQGQAGQNGNGTSSGGGGGAGLGGALFVGTGANVTISNIIVQNNAANGAAGGNGGASACGCRGGNSSLGTGGGTIDNNGSFGGGAGGFPVAGLAGGFGGGGSGAGAVAGGLPGGAGGFGGGSGGAAAAGPGGGGGGAGFGGAVFVEQGGFLTVSGTSTVTGNTALDGGGGTGDGGTNGGPGTLAFGGIFLQGNDANNGGSGTITFAPDTGQTLNDADGIADQTGLGGTSSPGSWSLVKNGAGLLVINASNNTYTGTTSINAGLTEVVGILGLTTSGDVTVANGAVLGGAGTVYPNVVLSPGGILQPGIGAGIPETQAIVGNLTWNGSAGTPMMKFNLFTHMPSDDIAVGGVLTKGSAGTFQFDFQNTGGPGIYGLMTFTSTTFSTSDFSFVNLAPGLIADIQIVSGNRLQLTVALAATSTGVSPSPSPVVAGAAETLTATVTSSAGTPTGTVTFVDSAATPTTLGTVALNGSGQASFSSTTLPVGANNITAIYNPPTGAWLSSMGTTSVTVNQATTHFSVTATSPETAGVAFNITVTALNSSNATVTGYNGTVLFTSSDGAATLPANSTLTNGTGTFPVTLKTAGIQGIVATDTVFNALAGSVSITVNPGPATHFTVSAVSPQTAGTAFNVTVTGLDQFSNTATGYSGTVHFTSTDGAANLSGNATLTNGTGTFSATLNTAGNQTITATDTVTGSITGTTPGIVVNPGVATHFSVSAASPQTVGFAFNVTVTAKDAGNNTVTGYSGTVHFTSTDSAAALPANSTLTNGTGTFLATLNTAATETITATDTVTTSITGVSGNIVVNAPASFVVTNSSDSGLGSLRAAINNANASPSPAVITFSGVTTNIVLGSALPALTQSMNIIGPGASILAVDGSGAYQVFYVTSGITATISGLTIQHGLDNGNTTGGGGVRNDGVLTLSSCVVTGNSQTNSGLGAGIFNNSGATLTINQCTVSNNNASGTGGQGGGLFNEGTATIVNSTFSGNIAVGGGGAGGVGGAINANNGVTTITGSTITGNTATDPKNTGTSQAGAISSISTLVVKNSTISGNDQTGSGGEGGGIAGRGITLTNTILAGNTDLGGFPDGVGSFTDGGHNLIGIGTGISAIANGSNGDQVGTAGTPLNPHLSALANNGGPTQTMLPNGNSPALGAGNTAGFLLTDTDQRGSGFLRLANNVIDIGAVQLQGVALAASAGTPQSANVSAAFGTSLAATATESCGACASVVPGVSVTFTAPGTGASGTFGSSATVTTNASGVATAPAFTANATAGGPYNVTASGTTPDQATAASATFALTNVGLTQTITGFGPIGAQTYGAVFLINGVSATSTLPVTFTSTTLSVCTVSGNAVSVVGTGPCAIIASQAGGGSYAAAANVPQSFTANQAPLTVNVQSTSKAYGAVLPAFATSSVVGLVHGDTVGTTITIGFSSTATAASPVNGVTGYPITANVGGTSAANYSITNNPGLLTINAVGLTVAVNPQTKAYGAALPTLTGNVTGLVNGDTVGGTITVGYSTTALAGSTVAGGPYPITALVGGSAIANYTLTNTPNQLSVTQVGLTVAVNPQTKVYGAALPTLTGNVTGLVNGDTVGGTITVGYSTTALAGSAVAGGPYPITALVGGSAIADYTLTNTPNVLTVTPASLTVTANNASVISGSSLPTLSAGITGFVNGDTLAVVTGAPFLSTTATAGSPPGTYPITVTLGTLSAANYTFTLVNGTLTLTQLVPVSISVVSGSGQSGAPGAPFAAPLVALVTDNLGGPMSGAEVFFTVVSGPATVSSQAIYTAFDGTARITATPTGSGAIVISAATSNAIIQPAVFNETGLSSSASFAPPQLTVLPSAITLTVVQGGDDPLPTNIAVSNTGSGVLQWTAADSGSPSWLSLSTASGTTPTATSAVIATSGLVPGSYKSTITVTSGSQQQTVAVTLTVVPAVPAQFTLTPAAVVVNTTVAANTPISRVINVENAGTATLNWNAAAGAGASWLSVSPASGSTTSGKAPSTLTVQVSPAGLAAGQYLGNVAFTSPGVPPANVPVVLNVAALPNLISSVPAIELRLAVGSGSAGTTLPITTSTGAAVSFTATGSVSSGASWLTLTSASGVTPASIFVSGSNSGLAAGNYVGYVSVQSPGAANTLVVPVVLDLANFSSLGTLAASPGGILFTGAATTTPGPPLTQTIILSSDAGSYTWTAGAVPGAGGSWLTVSPSTGTAVGASSVTVSANLAGLAPGSYTGQVAIGSTGTSNTELIIPVTLIVTSGTTAVTTTNTLQVIQPAGDFVAGSDVPVALQASLVGPTGQPITGATVQVTFTTGDVPVTLTDSGGGMYTGVWSPMLTGPVSLLFNGPNSPTAVVTGTVSASTGKQPAFTAAGVVSSADFLSGAPITPGAIGTIFGQNLAQTATATSYPLPLTLGGTSVTINGIPAPLFYTGSGQINFFVPYELAGQTTATIVISSAGGVAEVTGIPIAPESPGFYLEDAAGDASAVHLNGQLVSATDPAAPNETIEIYATGLGAVSNAPVDGMGASGNPLAHDQLTPVITIGGMNAQVMFAGLAPGFAGLYQLNVVVPAGLSAGANPMTISVGPLSGNTAVLQVQ